MQFLHNRLDTDRIGHVAEVHGKQDSNVAVMRPGMGKRRVLILFELFTFWPFIPLSDLALEAG